MTQHDWDDDRIDAAFHARFDRTAPESLAHDVHVRIAGTAPARFRLSRAGQPWSLAAAAVIVVLVGVALLSPAGLSLPGTSPAPAGVSSSERAATATPTEQALPGAIFGLPIAGVREAIAVRDSDPDDGSEIAVHGWFTPAPPVSCGPLPTGGRSSPIQLRCPDDLVWLTEDAESLVHVSGMDRTTNAPHGLALHPYLDGLATDWFPSLPVPGVDGGSTPADVVLVGHFVDRRANMCQDAEIAACRDRFVVDSVAYVGGVQQPTSRLQLTGNAISSDQDIAALVNREAPDSPILSTVVVDGPTGLAAIEPSLGTGQARLIDQPVLWVVRVLESGRLVTYVIIDGSDAIYEMNPAGEAILVGGTPPTPGTSAGPWPPAGALVLDLPGVDIGKPPVGVAIVDESGRFVSAMQQDPVTITPQSRFGATAEPGKPGRVNLAWVGGVCDSQITITVGADLRAITFDMGPQPDCDSIGVEHQLAMNFTGTVDVPAIRIDEGTAITTPTASPAYDLECLSFAPNDCQQRAREIIAATPSQRVIAIKIVDRCGSYRVTFSDGTSTNTIVDCVLGTGTAPSPQASGAS